MSIPITIITPNGTISDVELRSTNDSSSVFGNQDDSDVIPFELTAIRIASHLHSID